jgi:hypothetical protein
LSGRLLALNLLRFASTGAAVSIQMFDRAGEQSMGPAYSHEADYLLLNVPADRMGGRRIRGFWGGFGWHAQTGGIFPQGLSGIQLNSRARRMIVRWSKTDFIPEIIDVVPEHGSDPHGRRTYRRPVCAGAGNFRPAIHRSKTVDPDKHGMRHPWILALDPLSPRETVFLIGTGQTTADFAVALRRRTHEGRIVALSRHGLVPLAQRGFEPFRSFAAEIMAAGTILEGLRIVRRKVNQAESMGIDRRAAIDSLRSDTPAIWSSFPSGKSGGSSDISFVTGRSSAQNTAGERSRHRGDARLRPA